MPIKSSKSFRKFFQRKKKIEPTAQEAIAKLCETEELLIKKSEFLQKKIDQELEVARKNGTKNKRVSLMALKKKKRYEAEQEKLGLVPNVFCIMLHNLYTILV